LIGCLFVMAPAVGLFVLVIILAYSGMEIYGVMRRARVEVTPDAITIRRPLFRPIVIPKDAVVKVEVKENKLPIPYWLLVGALATIFVSAAGGMYYGLDNPASMRFISGLGGVIFFPMVFYRTYVRTHYPRTLTITTPKKIAAIYTDDPERMARMLEVS
ncbi:MAG: PH domain-containing protein, partial [Methanoculleus sp.]|nr:PH domain-containing protein [Methanoculleus sp.]